MSNRIRGVRRFYRLVLDLLLPPCCVVCGKVGTWLCEVCAVQIPLGIRPICQRCGGAWSKGGLCLRCQTTPLSVAPVRSALLFEGVVRDAIHALKYRGADHIAELLAVKMADAWQYYNMMGDVLIPVPLHPEREAQRGYNQATLLARALAPQISVPLAEDLLFRVRPTRSQTHLDRVARWENVADAFACPDSVDLSGLSVILIDDVATTGATLDACAAALLTRGVRQVGALTLAHAI